ncbi:MAG: hypothetical protein L3V56_13870 [Candidatus Magnetoovum sp. WYHC-5]|nr:hypothetical protein [Candidatus Magnetoovum sp. WYHC-5]
MKRTINIILVLLLVTVLAGNVAYAKDDDGQNSSVGFSVNKQNDLVVSSAGTAYILYPSNAAGQNNYSGVPVTNIVEITADGTSTVLSLSDTVTEYALSEEYSVLVAASKSGQKGKVSDEASYNSTSSLYIVSLPLSAGVTPITVSFTGLITSKPSVVGGKIYVTTSEVTKSSEVGGAKYSNRTNYLNVVGLDGTVESKTSY